jgi:colicin import membrane protein
MWDVIKRSPTAAVSAIILHVLILLFLIFGLDWVNLHRPAEKAVVVQAHVVDAEKMQAEMDKLKQAEAVEQAAKDAALRAQQQQLEELKRRQSEEQQRLQQLAEQRKAQELVQQRREAEAKRQAQLKKQQEAKRKAEAKRQAEIEAKRKADEEARRKAEAEAKRQAEEEAKRKAEAEAKAKAEEEAKRKAEAKAKAEAEAAARAAREKALQDQLAAEQNAREIDRYAAMIRQQVTRSWLRPPNTGQGLSCVVEVRLIPGGDVMPGGVRVIKSSGNATFDRSVENAVYKAAPYTVPSGGLFESFRNFKLFFNPQ